MRTLESALDLQSIGAAELARLASLHLILHISLNRSSGSFDPYVRNGGSLQTPRDYIDRALKKEPDNPCCSFSACRSGGQEASALASMDNGKGRAKMIELLASLDTMEDTARVRFVRGRLVGSLGWREGQMKLFEPAIEHSKRAVEAWSGLTEMHPSQAHFRYEWTGALRDLAFLVMSMRARVLKPLPPWKKPSASRNG